MFALTDIVIQISNQVKAQKYNAPMLVLGQNVLTDETGKILYEPAPMERPLASEDFSEELLLAINTQINQLGLRIIKEQEEKE